MVNKKVRHWTKKKTKSIELNLKHAWKYRENEKKIYREMRNIKKIREI